MMKASKIIERYNNRKRDFHYVNLIDQSFIKQNLSGIDFSYADIRGADFSGATLIGANFSYTKAGINPKWQKFWGLGLFLSIFILGIFAAFPGILMTISLDSEINIFSIICNIFLLIIFVWLTVIRGLSQANCVIFTVFFYVFWQLLLCI